MIVHEWSAESTDPEAEGRRLGEAWAPQLRAAHASYLELFAQSGVPAADAVDVARACGTAVAEHAPEVAAEFRGVAAGSGLALTDVLMLTARTEILARMTPSIPSMECSTIVHVPEAGAPRTLQTWDWHQTLSNETLVRRWQSASGARVAAFAEFGQPAKIGVNDRGVGVHFNILHHRSDGSQAGVPVHVLARMILDRAESVDDAASIARSVPLAASSVITVVDRDSAAAIEVAPAGVAVLPVSRGETFAHTNHFLDPGLAAREYSPYETTSVPRYTCLVDNAELAGIPDARERALAFGAVAGDGISVRPRPEQPDHLRWETKLTVALDVASGALEFAAGAPADIASLSWRRFTAV
ncbi:C45 family peptidase [Microbacterium sp. cf332]|uniref:C45 family autoproteolytic acyltransferase/hydolase n=1 Tax=Microbacterium sp. cf332 TaxID=1761804 RepID=UPI00088F112C|nr:C45 family peptidase [Microbacterium sp. cf332]SDQ64790.1 isopenicillin-N N-acyltransferase like protein [Microbacterium sp. cf332]